MSVQVIDEGTIISDDVKFAHGVNPSLPPKKKQKQKNICQ